MDIYGYGAYQYNESDDLAKQMFAQQALASSVQYSNPQHGMPGQEVHTMPVPTGTPWNVQSIPWSLQSPPNLVHFTAQMHKPVLHCKRKSTELEPVM